MSELTVGDLHPDCPCGGEWVDLAVVRSIPDKLDDNGAVERRVVEDDGVLRNYYMAS